MNELKSLIGKTFTPKGSKHYVVKLLEVVPFNFGGLMGTVDAAKVEFNDKSEDVRHYVAERFLKDYELKAESPAPVKSEAQTKG